MKISNKKYCLWTVLVGLLVTSNMNGQADPNYYEHRYWNGYEYGYNNGYKEGYNYASKNQPKIIHESQINSADIVSMGLGMSIGIVCVLGYNYVISLQENDKLAPEDIDTKTDEQTGKTSPLQFKKRFEILNNSFSSIDKLNLNMPLITSITAGYSRAKLEKFITIVKRSATLYNINFTTVKNIDAPIHTVCPITMDHVNQAIDEMYGGSANYKSLDTKRVLKTAIHEAGHAIAIVNTAQCILYSVSIINRSNSLGRCLSTSLNGRESWTLEDYKNEIIISLCGGLAEQIFGFDRSWYEGRYPAGAEQAFNECCKLAKNKNISHDLADLLAIPGAVGDMMRAREQALYIAKRYIALQPSNQDKEDKPGQIENHQCKILEECYRKALNILKMHKSTIEKIAQLLMKDDIISGDQVYALCNLTTPAYPYEQ